jgi:hypothetical protein
MDDTWTGHSFSLSSWSHASSQREPATHESTTVDGWCVDRTLIFIANVPPIAEESKNVPIAKIRIHPTGWLENWGSNFVGAGWIYTVQPRGSEALRFHRWIYRQGQSI